MKRKAPGFRGVLKELAWPLVAGIVTVECEIGKYKLINSMHPKKMRSPRVSLGRNKKLGWMRGEGEVYEGKSRKREFFLWGF